MAELKQSTNNWKRIVLLLLIVLFIFFIYLFWINIGAETEMTEELIEYSNDNCFEVGEKTICKMTNVKIVNGEIVEADI